MAGGHDQWVSGRAARRLLPEGWPSGPMPWVIAIMMFLMVLAAAAGLALGLAANSLDRSLTAQVTIQIVDANQARRDAAAARIIAGAKAVPGVARVDRVSDAAMTELLRPWLGGGLADTDLPVPAMIDIAFAPAPGNAPAAVRALAMRISPAARIDDHAQWLRPLAGLMGSLRWLAGVLVLMMAAAAAFTVVLAARAALNTHRSTIEVLHLLGSTDGQIASLFQRRIALDALTGGMVGLLLASLVIVTVGERIVAVGSDLLGTIGLPVAAWGLLALLPIAGTVLAMFAARMTILASLRRRL
ncbi:cell division protein FtsX [Sphingomonas montanisoli]|uniref:Cell division protein n=1 Tax=Sphingomonas montanisoli TaxID=2606412 RepID=A0A5D9C3U5_9SPHN|nr:cell division protein [Sphingomonas montanisoli]TZG25977.1 cell division protein [Sphingomonas montanisoli]